MSVIAGSYGKNVFGFVRHCQSVFQSGCTILHFCQQWVWGTLAPHPAFGIVSVLDFHHSNRCSGISLVFYLHLPNDMLCWVSFRVLVCHLLSSLVRCLFRFFVHFLIGWFIFLLLSFRSSLYVLDSSPLSNMSFADILSQSVACLLIPLRWTGF